jgi:hypothetical protein
MNTTSDIPWGAITLLTDYLNSFATRVSKLEGKVALLEEVVSTSNDAPTMDCDVKEPQNTASWRMCYRHPLEDSQEEAQRLHDFFNPVQDEKDGW